MGSQVTLAYKVRPFGRTAAQFVTLAGAGNCPLPLDVLSALGLRVTSDITAFAAPDVVRTIILSFLPAVTALGHVDLLAGDPSGAPLFDVVRDAAGFDYVRPPQVVLGINPGLERQAIVQAYLDVAGIANLVGGSGYTTPTVKFVGGFTNVWQPVGPAGGTQNNVKDPDGVYLQGVAATGHATVVLGAITGIVIDTPGLFYIQQPQIVITDPVGTGASATAVMEVGPTFSITDPGIGYTPPAPPLTFNPWFKTMFPDGTDQKKPFWDLFTGLIARATLSPVTALAPVVA